MTRMESSPGLSEEVRQLVLRGSSPRFGELAETFPSHGLWSRLRELGSELWLDTGNMGDADDLWTREMTALTTNNTLLNREIQTGRYDDLVRDAAGLLDAYELDERTRRLELAFVLNAHHALRLVERFDAFVSVEEHTDLAHDPDGALAYARRYYAVCPERFIVKIPLTPAGLLATRRAAAEGIPVNHTLGFSARQNVVVAGFARPKFVNVFLGRLNAFVADNRLGDGAYVGERATLASQAAVRCVGESLGTKTRQIGASIRDGGQVRDLAGLDVLTMPPSAAREFLELGLAPGDLSDRTGEDYRPAFADGVDPEAVGLNTLWDVPDGLADCIDALEEVEVDAMEAADLVGFFHDHGFGDLLVAWRPEDIETSAAEGKVPTLQNWHDRLESGAIGLDALMNLAGLNSFAADQRAMDDHVAEVLADG